MSRRTVLAAGLGLTSWSLTGCSRPGGSAPPQVDPSAPEPSGASARPSQAPTLAPAPRWSPPAGEVEVDCKITAVDAAVAALTVRQGGRRAAVPEPLRPLAALVPDTAQSTLDVVYPQYGGLSDDRTSACVMLVAELVTLDAAQATRLSMTLDLRLARRGQRWQVTAVRIPQARTLDHTAPDAVAAVLAERRVVLPREARLDLIEGVIDARVVDLITHLSRRWTLDVLVLRAGHPRNVFGTDRPSNHTGGRAVDLWALDGIPVIDHVESPWRQVMRAAADHGCPQIGGPDKLGTAPPYFTDHVHQDHLHLGFHP